MQSCWTTCVCCSDVVHSLQVTALVRTAMAVAKRFTWLTQLHALVYVVLRLVFVSLLQQEIPVDNDPHGFLLASKEPLPEASRFTTMLSNQVCYAISHKYFNYYAQIMQTACYCCSHCTLSILYR
jgi:hypothetical protein